MEKRIGGWARARGGGEGRVGEELRRACNASNARARARDARIWKPIRRDVAQLMQK